MQDVEKTNIKTVRYRVYPNEEYVFRWYLDRNSANVHHPNGTSCQSTEAVISVDDFLEYVLITTGPLLVGQTLSTFTHLFRKNFKQSIQDFTLNAAVLVSACMSDSEKKQYRAQALQIDDAHFQKCGLRLDLTEFENAIVGRYKPLALALLQQFRETVDRS